MSTDEGMVGGCDVCAGLSIDVVQGDNLTCAGCGRRWSTTAQAVKVAAGVAPPLTPEGFDARQWQDIYEASAEVIDRMRRALWKIRDITKYASEGERQLVLCYNAACDGLGPAPIRPAAGVEVDPSRGLRPLAPEGIGWKARAEAAEKTLAEDRERMYELHASLNQKRVDAERALAAAQAERDRMREAIGDVVRDGDLNALDMKRLRAAVSTAPGGSSGEAT